MRKYKIKWQRGEETGFATQRGNNADHARIRFQTDHPDVDEVEVILPTKRSSPKANFYEVGLAILATQITGFKSKE